METRQLFQLDSTNVHPEHWKTIARAILEAYDDYDGFVITHGTDTMAYTAAGPELYAARRAQTHRC